MTTLQLMETIGAVAGIQHGVVSRSQLRRLGVDRGAVRRWVAAGVLEPVTPRVLRLTGAARTFRQRCAAAVLDAGRGALVSQVTAASLWNLPGFSEGAIHVSRHQSDSHRSSRLAAVHHPRLLPPHHATVLDGIPVTTVARTLFDLAGCVHPQRAERALDNALTRGYVTLEPLRRVTIELLERGRTGSTLMRSLLAERGAGHIPPASGLEARFLALVVAAGLEIPEGQVDVGAETWIARVDYFYRRLRLVIEIDSDLHHTSKLDRESDARRDAALEAAGFEVVRFTEHQLRNCPEEVVAAVRNALKAVPAGI